MSAINLYTTKEEALYFKDSQRNSFYEFGGIQLLPNNTYTQKVTGIDLKSAYAISILKVADDSVMGSLSYSIQEIIDDTTSHYWSITPTKDCYNNLIYLKFTYGSTNYYTNPFYITAFDEDRTTKFSYKDLESNYYESIGLKTWFRQKSNEFELTTYYESSTGNTVTQAVKSKSLEMYESEPMSMDDLILTSQILESPYLYIKDSKYSLFESVKIPELTQQENFGKIKFTLAGKSQYDPTTSIDLEYISMPDARLWARYNLNTDKYRDGTPIPEVKTGWQTLKTGAWRYYEDSSENGTIYGRLYNWYAMMGIHTEESVPPTTEQIANRKNIAPYGFSVATEAEWLTLRTSLGNYWATGTVLKESGSEHWIPTGGTNTTNFTALPAGSKSSNNSTEFTGIGIRGAWWSKDTTALNVFMLRNNSTLLERYYTGISKNRGSSIRLIKDSGVITGFITKYPTGINASSLLGTGGYIPNNGVESPTSRGIVYATTSNPTINNSDIVSGAGFGDYTINITTPALTPNKIYYIRAYAIFPSTGISYADQVIVSTSDSKPQVSTNDITEISTETATCGGYVESNSGINLIERGVCWNTTGNPTISSPNFKATSGFTGGNGLGDFIVDIKGLTAGETYYVRAYARNSSAIGYGEEKQFTSLVVPSINLIFNQYTAYHAYSLRRLSNTFNYKCLRVRRTTTTPSATTTLANVLFNSNSKIGLDSQIVYVSGCPTGATTLGEFAASVSNGYDNVDEINANQDIFINIWYDQSGNDKDVTQNTFDSQPKIVSNGNLETLSSEATMRFSGSESLFIDDSTIPYSNSSFYVLGSATSTEANTMYSLGYFENNARLFLPQRNRIAYNNSSTTSHDWTSIPFTENTQALYGLIANSTTASAYWNGIKMFPDTVPSLLVNSTRIRIGFAGYLPTLYLTGTIQEVIALVGTPSKTDIESNINAYYTIWW